MQQRIGERRLLPEVRGLAQQLSQWMSGWQRRERGDEIADPLIGGRDADPPAEFLQHVDAGPSVRRIHHEVHRAVRLEHAAQRPEPGVGIRQMVQHAGADDLIEASSPARRRDRSASWWTSRLSRWYLRLSSSVWRTLVALKSIPVTRAAGQRIACLAACDVPQPGDQDGVVFPVGSRRPEQMKVRAAPVRILPEPSDSSSRLSIGRGYG